MPPEWRRHDFTLMSWPVRPDAWLDGLTAAREGYAEVAQAIADFEPVVIIARDAGEDARKRLGAGIEIWNIPHDDSWIRDNGPTFLLKPGLDAMVPEIAAVKWRFNAWGEKYRPYDADDRLASLILERLNIRRFDAPLVLEGGSIHTDGEGTILTTAECLLAANRNPRLSRNEIEEYLKLFVGASTIVWLPKGLYGDETDGHIDNVACFVRPGLIAMQLSDDPTSPDFAAGRDNLAILAAARDAAGRGLEVVAIPSPPSLNCRGERLTLSYINYYPVDGGLVVPVFGTAGDQEMKRADDRALGILRELYPDRRVVGIDGLKIIQGGGNVHCITQQGYGRRRS